MFSDSPTIHNASVSLWVLFKIMSDISVAKCSPCGGVQDLLTFVSKAFFKETALLHFLLSIPNSAGKGFKGVA